MPATLNLVESHVTTYAALRERFLQDGQGQARLAETRLTAALDDIGWRSADGLESAEVAETAVEIVRECVHGHRDVARAEAELAELLRAAAAMLDGGSIPAAMFIPAAEDVLQRYVTSRLPDD